MQPAGGEAEQKAQVLLRWVTTLEPKISFETHTFGAEYQHADTHPDRCRGDGWDAEFRTTSKGAAPDVDGKEVKPIDKQINAVKEPSRLSEHIPSGNRVIARDGLVALAISSRTSIFGRPIVSIVAPTWRLKFAKSKRSKSAIRNAPIPRRAECQEVGPTNSAHSRDRNTLPAKRHLFRLGEPAEVPFEGKLIVELGSGHSAP